MKYPKVLFATILVVILSGCAVLFPDRSAPKSESYSFRAPAKPWKTISPGERPDAEQAQRADVAFENQDNGAIISLNSICRKYQKYTLDELTKGLLLGLNLDEQVDERFIKISGVKAKNTVYLSRIDDVEVKIRAVVLKKDDCMYDFIYVVVKEKDHLSNESFEQFLASFRVK